MTENEKSVRSQTARTRRVAKVLWITLALNWGTAFLKVLFGLLTQCMVIVADGVHSFSDGASNIIGLVGIAISAHPPDADRPYSRQKYETLASVVIALLLFLVSFGIFRGAIDGLFRPRAPQVNAASFFIMGSTLLVNFFVVWYERKEGKELDSDLLISDSWHTMTDIFVTAAVFVALIGIRLNIPKLDSIFSLSIATLIVVVAFRILKHSFEILLDKPVLKLNGKK